MIKETSTPVQIVESLNLSEKEAQFISNLKNDPEGCKKFLLYVVPKLPKGNGSGSFSNFARFNSTEIFGGERLIKFSLNDNKALVKALEDGKIDDKTLYPLVGNVFGWLSGSHEGKEGEGEKIINMYNKENKESKEQEKNAEKDDLKEESAVPINPETGRESALDQDPEPYDPAFDFDNDIVDEPLDTEMPDFDMLPAENPYEDEDDDNSDYLPGEIDPEAPEYGPEDRF